MKKVNLRRTITGFAAAAVMAFTAIAPTALNASPIAPTAVSASAATINMSQAEFERGQHIYSFLKSHTNWNDGAICGILTHLYTESRYIPTAENKVSKAYGVAQWLGQRKTYLKQKANYTNIDVQLQFLIDEINNNDPCASDDFKLSRNAILSAANSAAGAGNTVYTFRMNYGWGVSVPANASASVISDCNQRKSEAAFFYTKFAGGDIGGGGSNTELPYTVTLTSGTPVYKDAGSSTINTYISVTTLYTIVEEKTVNNIKYGKLKSGAGWVKLEAGNTDEVAVNYTKQLAKGTPIYKDAGSSVVNQYLSTAGTYTIIGEKIVNSVKYGRLKSGAGWVKL